MRSVLSTILILVGAAPAATVRLAWQHETSPSRIPMPPVVAYVSALFLKGRFA